MLKKKNKAGFAQEKAIVPLFFLILLLTGIFLYQDYGLSWDASYTRERGILNYNYIRLALGVVDNEEEKTIILKEWESYPYHDHGAFFDLLTTTAEKIFAIESAREAYMLRHLIIFLFFFVGVWFFYLTLRQRLNWQLALTGSLFLVLSPRIFAHAYFNPKDIIFMVLCIISLYTLIRIIQNPAYKNLILHAFVSAVAIDIRITGLYIPAISMFFILFSLHKQKNALRQILTKVILYVILLFMFVVLFWPHLWKSPFAGIYFALDSLSAYNWDDLVLYRGNYISAVNLPWHYLFTWIGISTPLLYLLLFMTGLYSIFNAHSKSHLEQDLAVVSFLIVPLMAVIILDSTLYDGWRQLYFIYPPLLIIAVYGLSLLLNRINSISNPKAGKVLLMIIIIANSSYLLNKMAVLHPYQHLYFNWLAGKQPEKKYELDYWGLSYRETYEKLLVHNEEDTISFIPGNRAGYVNLNLLDEEQRQRLHAVSWDSAKYFITNYRWADRQKIASKAYPYSDQVLTIERSGMIISGVYRLRE